jgi:hypothetical protein
MRSACRRAAASLAVAVLWVLPTAAAEEDDKVKKEDLPADAAKAKVEGVVLKSHRPEKEEKGKDVTPVSVVLGEKKTGRRKTVVAPSVGAAARGVREATIAGRRQVYTTFELREPRYTGWAESELISEPGSLPTGTVLLTELATSIELACPREVKAGEPIVLHVKSVGNLDIDWDVSLEYPDGGAYEKASLTAGDKVGGDKRVQKVSFTTWPADRGALLGVRVKRPERSEDGAIFWVTVR